MPTKSKSKQSKSNSKSKSKVELGNMTAYCLKCQSKIPVSNLTLVKIVITKNNRSALTGMCPHKHKIYRFLPTN